jgi:hypothetical protein
MTITGLFEELPKVAQTRAQAQFIDACMGDGYAYEISHYNAEDLDTLAAQGCIARQRIAPSNPCALRHRAQRILESL